jgi:beta-1,2-mannobiose phosphorylase / 1,2-beta-oligomannan phosphorylase
MHYPVKKNSNAKIERKSFWEKYFPTFSRFFVAKNSKKVSATKNARPQILKKIPVTTLRRPKTALPKIFTMRGMMLKKEKKRGEARGQESHLKLQRGVSNPILKPHARNDWESQATFNPAAIYADGKVHLVYRAIGKDDISVLGYACSQDGRHIHERLADPMFVSKKKSAPDRTGAPAAVSSGGGWNGGCEDPRLTRIGDTLYLLYTAFDGWGSIRIALSSISLDDFLHKRWNWEDPVLVSPTGEANKNWVLFPEKINGKFAILHNLSPNILVDYFDSLDELKDGRKVIRLKYVKTKRKNAWDTWVRAAGPPPIKTKYGWLLLYHAVDEKEPDRYKLGAMILDMNDPTKILYRSKAPILEPNACYENEGFKPGIVYSCGAVVIDGDLLVYYGGADCVTCVASAELEPFLKELVSSGKPKIKNLDRNKTKKYAANQKIKK